MLKIIVCASAYLSLLFTVMLIGFTQRVRTVSESDVEEGEELFPIDIDVATLRPADREYKMIFRLLPGGTAIVEPGNNVQDESFDVLFGTKVERNGHIQEEFDLEPLVTTIPPRVVYIRDDLRPEDEECFTMRIFPVDVPGHRELFDCNENDSDATNYFCETTICILDNDGGCGRMFLPSEFYKVLI